MKKTIIAVLLVLSGIASAESLKVMQFNAENLFDTTFDEGRNDFTYLPVATKRSMPAHAAYCESQNPAYKDECFNLDWTPTKLRSKIMNLAKVIKAFDSTGKGPDILVLQEVENINVLNMLAVQGLGGLGYNYRILIEGDDSRGIDVAILSKYPVANRRRHPIVLNGQTLDTRGILEVTFNVNGKRVLVFGNHWPSQNNPVEERIEAAKVLNRYINSTRADLMIAVGDFNVTKKDNPSPFKQLFNCFDAETEAKKVNSNLNPGTHYYRGEWASLDRILVHAASKIQPDYKTFQIMTPAFMMTRDPKTGAKIPLRFNATTGQGYSDHLPIGMIFNY